MANMSNYLENLLVDGLFRGGALAAGGGVNSTAVVKGVWTATTAYVAGDTVTPHALMTAGGGKFLRCTTAGTSGSTNTLAVPAVGSTLTDGTVTWTAVSGLPSLTHMYSALFSINKGLRANSTAYSSGDCISLTANGGAGGDTNQHVYRCTTAGTTASSQTGYLGVPGEAITDGTAVFTEISPVFDANTGFPAGLAEISGGSYARVDLAGALANWAGTQSAGSTTASSGTSGTTSNNSTITFPAPTSNWASGAAMIGAIAIYDQLTGGNLIGWAPLSAPKTVNNGDAAPSFAAAALSIQVDN
jgi:hypothetical protein